MHTAAKISVALLSIVFVCGATGPSPESGFPKETGVVLTGAAGLALISSCTALAYPTKQWDPDEADVAAAETALLPGLTAALAKMKDPANAADYFRQYAGGFYEGDHILYVRGFHLSYLDSLRSESGRKGWRSRVVPTGRGHTRFWCAHWVKETRHLVRTQSGADWPMDVGFIGIPE